MTVLALAELTPQERSQFEQRDRANALEQAHAAGRRGASRIPDEVLFAGGRDPSDTAIHALLTAFEAGQLVRRQVRADQASDPGYRDAVAEELLQQPENIP